MYEYEIEKTLNDNFEITNDEGIIIGYTDSYDDAIKFITKDANLNGILYYEIYY